MSNSRIELDVMKPLRVLLLGPLRLLCAQELTMACPLDRSQVSFWASLMQRFPELHTQKPTTRLARNGEFMQPGELLAPGDEIALIPPVSGGKAARIDVLVQTGSIELEPCIVEGSGASVRFEGRVRPLEDGKQIEALVYEAYMPMAQAQMERIVVELDPHQICQLVRVRHRIGRVPVGEIAIAVEVFSPHRAEAFALAAAFMDRLKQDVPIWKMEAVSSHV